MPQPQADPILKNNLCEVFNPTNKNQPHSLYRHVCIALTLLYNTRRYSSDKACLVGYKPRALSGVWHAFLGSASV